MNFMKLFNKLYNKYNKNNRKQRRRIRGRYATSIRQTNYQYSPTTQVMGPGTTVKNFERLVTIPANTNIIASLSTFLEGGDLEGSIRSYRYLKILGVLITQNNLNLPNEQDNVYVRVCWAGDYEEETDIDRDDASKILPNIGKKSFTFKPPDAQVSFTRNGTTITVNMRHFLASEHLIQADDEYKIPGNLQIYNKTTQERKIRLILRVKFRGSKVLDVEEEAKRVLVKRGYVITREQTSLDKKEN